MTRNQFIEEVNNFGDLVQYVCDTGNDPADYANRIISEDDYDSYVEDDIRDFLANDYWHRGLADYLYELPTDYEWYYRDGLLEYKGLSYGDFEEYKDEVIGFCDDNDYWDEEDEDEDEEAPASVVSSSSYTFTVGSFYEPDFVCNTENIDFILTR